MRNILTLVTIGLAGVSLLLFAACSRPAEGPNVILVSIDTLRADRLGAYGGPKNNSPFLDSLARDGAAFRNTAAQANWTLPSHVSLLTSLYPGVHRVQEGTQRMSDSLITMAEILQKEGYGTAAFVDGGVLDHKFGFAQGFELYDDSSRGEKKDAGVLDWLQRHRRGPFFLFYHTYDAHYPYRHHTSPRDYGGDPELKDFAGRINAGQFDFSDEEFAKGIVAWYTDPDFYRTIDLDDVSPMKSRMVAFMKDRWPAMPTYSEDRKYLLDAYDGGISFADRRLEKLWDGIGSLGLDKNTVLVVTSDHGECFLEHGALGHPALLYDEILRVPLIIAYPPLDGKGRMIDDQVMSIDILPTLLDILGIDTPPHLQGRSLLPLIEKAGSLPGQPAFSDAVEVRSIRTDGWKYIRGAGKDAPAELYDLRADPAEKVDIALSGDAPERDRLDSELRRRRTRDAALAGDLGLDAAPEKVELDTTTLNELKALGYIQ